jgi:hypothetical protein
VSDNLNIKDVMKQQYSQLTFENVGGQFKFYDFNTKEYKIELEVNGKGINYFLEEKEALAKLLTDILELELEVEKEKQVFYNRNGDINYTLTMLEVFDTNKNKSLSKEEMKEGMGKI